MGASICGRYIWQIMEKRAPPQGVARGGGGGSPLRRRSERNLKSRKERCSAARRSGAAISWDSKVSARVIALVSRQTAAPTDRMQCDPRGRQYHHSRTEVHVYADSQPTL